MHTVRITTTKGTTMGLIRKAMSVGTIGLIDFKSDKERIASNTKESAKQAKQQTKALREQLKLQQKLQG